MRKQCLIWHSGGIGDAIMLTPILRTLAEDYDVDVLACSDIVESGLFAACPYIRTQIPAPIKPDRKHSGEEVFSELRGKYDKAHHTALHQYIHQGIAPEFKKSQDYQGFRGGKQRGYEVRCGVGGQDNGEPEVFIDTDSELVGEAYAMDQYPRGFIFVHTSPPKHPGHNWDAEPWIRQNLPKLPIFRPLENGSPRWPNINACFKMLEKASCVVLSSSVFAHACDALKVQMDVVNYSLPAPWLWPKNPELIRFIRQQDKWSKDGGKTWQSEL